MSFLPRSTRRARPARVVPFLALVLLAVAACGGGDGGATAPDTPPTPAPVARVTASAAVDTLLVGDRHTLSAQPLDARGTALAGRAVAWTSQAPLVATVSEQGVVTGLVPGQTTVVATSEGQSATIAVVVLPQPVARVLFADSAVSRDIGDTTSALARLYDRNGALLTGRPVVYASSHPAVARVDSLTGAITAVAPGTALISATSEGQVGTLRFTVLPPPPVARVVVAGGPVALDEGATALLAATTLDSLGRTLGDRAVTWTSSDVRVATVAADGRVTAVRAGSAVVTATSEGRSASVAVTVSRVPVAYVLIVARATQRTVGDTMTLAATAYSVGGGVLAGRAATFASDAPAVATVDATTGLVRAVSPGAATITATVEGKSQGVRVDVAALPPVQIALAPTTLSLDVGRTGTLAVTGRDRDGRTVAVSGVTFTSSAPSVATVGPATGVVTGVATGTTVVTAAVGTLRASATVTVVSTPIVAPPTTSTGTGTYAIDLRFLGTASADLQTLARQAAARWAQIITTGLTPHRVYIPANSCDLDTPSINETIPNLVVLVRIGAIDGPDGTVAFAGPCVLRDSPAGPGTGLPSVGAITLDSVDLRKMLNAGEASMVQDVITHEMGHILGIGTLWDSSWNPTRVLVPLWSDASADLSYMGGSAITASAALGFTLPGAPVPVENGGGEGTRGSHWRESVFRTELMTGYLNTRNPLSTITVGALRDLGYAVSDARADAFSPATAATGGRANRIAAPGVRINERVFAPRRVRDASGRVIVVPPGVARAQERR